MHLGGNSRSTGKKLRLAWRAVEELALAECCQQINDRGDNKHVCWGVAQPDVPVQLVQRSDFSPQCHHNNVKTGEWPGGRVFAL